MKQLINQLQRTACTPRDSLAGLGDVTPRALDGTFSANSMGEMHLTLTVLSVPWLKVCV